VSATGFVVDLREWILHAGHVSRRVSPDEGELPDNEGGVCGVRVGEDLGNLIRDATQE
jgi:hypothetical protein